MTDGDERDSKPKFRDSVVSAIYSAIITLGVVFVVFMGYGVVRFIKFMAFIVGPALFTILETGFGLMILLIVVQRIKRKRRKNR